MNNLLTIGIYRRSGRQASLVFRKGNQMIYRITAITDAPVLVNALRVYEHNLYKNLADPKFVVEVLCPRNRQRVLEISLLKGMASCCVFEKAGSAMDLCFKWRGSEMDLVNSMRQFTVMAFMSRY
ncbi:MAG: hypothetical protein V4594_23650 [Bacteroidota bacterium]